ncbi:MAG: YebC/PmpR family DNA-binding transcriptional regulator [Patescibacteria group bacterium]|nr:YebC/PmpR family DNA-binding transcriptional regulator [Patescibacteria group bacterium]
MSGHSKWATIKRAKSVTDAKRGAVFTKLGNIITIAVRERGGDPNANPSLRMAIDKARSVNMPKDNIERAIKRGTGELGGDIVEELYYEAVLPNNVQFIIKCLTDNKNRSAAVVRHALSKSGGSLASVMWNFEQKGVIIINREELDKNNIDIENFQLDLIDLGIDDFKIEEDLVLIYTKVEDLQKIKSFIEDRAIKIESGEIEYIAKEKQSLSAEEAEKIDRFIEELEELEDVSDYYNNLD